MAFTAPVFMKFMITQWNYVEIAHTKFHSKGSRNRGVGVIIDLSP